MHQLTLTNTTLLNNLLNLTDCVFNNQEILDGLTARCRYITDNINSNHIGYSNKYLEEALTYPVKDYSFPRCGYGVDTGYNNKRQSGYWHKIARPLLRPLINYIGSDLNTLCMFYPSNGYLGWHHNGNAAGYTLVLTYSVDGDGYFKYYNQHTNEYNVLQDSPGWNFRFGYYPDQDREPENVFWHTAFTKKPRLTLGFIVPNRTMWRILIEECCSLDKLPIDLSEIGPKEDV